jgi:hypothetical protein
VPAMRHAGATAASADCTSCINTVAVQPLVTAIYHDFCVDDGTYGSG